MSVVEESIRLGRAARSTYHGLQVRVDGGEVVETFAARTQAGRLEDAVFWHMLDPTWLSGPPFAADAGFARVGSLRASGELTAKKRSF